MIKPIGADLFADPEPLTLDFGGSLHGIEIAYETWGQLAAGRDNTILVCPAFSAHCHANSSRRDPSPGWWEGMIGPGRAFDTDRYCVLCPSLLGGNSGTTGPRSIDPATGVPYRGGFPVVTVRDIVTLHIRLLDHLGIERLYAVAGGSLGAMEALELAVAFPGRAARCIAASGTDYTRPYTAAIRHIGRRAITMDPAFKGGAYEGDGPVEGLRLARELGTLFYRSREEFNERFPWAPIHPPSRSGITFDVQSYLNHQGKKVRGRFDANSYLAMSLAMDLHNVWRHTPSRHEALLPVDTSFMVIGVEEDQLIPVDEQTDLSQALQEAGKTCCGPTFSSPIGHDAFLVDLERMTALIRDMLR